MINARQNNIIIICYWISEDEMAEYTRESIKAACMYHSLYFKIARRVYDVMDFEIILPLTITTIIFILAHVIIKHQLKIQLFFFSRNGWYRYSNNVKYKHADLWYSIDLSPNLKPLFPFQWIKSSYTQNKMLSILCL